MGQTKKVVIKQRISFKSEVSSRQILEKFALNVLGATNVLRVPGVSILKLGDGGLLEFYKMQSAQPDHIFDNAGMILSFKVDDIEKAVESLQEDGALLMSKVVRVCPTYAYCYVQLQDYVVGLFQEE